MQVIALVGPVEKQRHISRPFPCWWKGGVGPDFWFSLCSGRCVSCLRVFQGREGGMVGCVHFSTPPRPSSTFISHVRVLIIFGSKDCGLSKKKKKANHQTRYCEIPFRNRVLCICANKVEVFYFGVVGFWENLFFFFLYNSFLSMPGTMCQALCRGLIYIMLFNPYKSPGILFCF